MSTGTKEKSGAYGVYLIIFVIQLPDRTVRIPVTNIPSKVQAPPIEAIGLLIFYSVLAKKAFCGLVNPHEICAAVFHVKKVRGFSSRFIDLNRKLPPLMMKWNMRHRLDATFLLDATLFPLKSTTVDGPHPIIAKLRLEPVHVLKYSKGKETTT
jgi:hypothetical protein